jgi:hypothetical protein
LPLSGEKKEQEIHRYKLKTDRVGVTLGLIRRGVYADDDNVTKNFFLLSPELKVTTKK